MPTDVDQAKTLFAATDLVRFPLKAKLSPQDLIRLVAPISACIDKTTTDTMEYKWCGECQRALAIVQGRCLDIVEYISITIDEIIAYEQHTPIVVDTRADAQATGVPMRIVFSTSYGLLMERSTQSNVSLSPIPTTYVSTWPHKITTRTPKLGHTRVKS